jgi:hypothetical protein
MPCSLQHAAYQRDCVISESITRPAAAACPHLSTGPSADRPRSGASNINWVILNVPLSSSSWSSSPSAELLARDECSRHERQDSRCEQSIELIDFSALSANGLVLPAKGTHLFAGALLRLLPLPLRGCGCRRRRLNTTRNALWLRVICDARRGNSETEINNVRS